MIRKRKIMFCKRDMYVDSVGELTVWHGNEFQTLAARFVII